MSVCREVAARSSLDSLLQTVLERLRPLRERYASQELIELPPEPELPPGMQNRFPASPPVTVAVPVYGASQVRYLAQYRELSESNASEFLSMLMREGHTRLLSPAALVVYLHILFGPTTVLQVQTRCDLRVLVRRQLPALISDALQINAREFTRAEIACHTTISQDDVATSLQFLYQVCLTFSLLCLCLCLRRCTFFSHDQNKYLRSVPPAEDKPQAERCLILPLPLLSANASPAPSADAAPQSPPSSPPTT